MYAFRSFTFKMLFYNGVLFWNAKILTPKLATWVPMLGTLGQMCELRETTDLTSAMAKTQEVPNSICTCLAGSRSHPERPGLTT